MKILCLAGLKDYSEDKVKEHLIEDYHDDGSLTDFLGRARSEFGFNKNQVIDFLNDSKVLIAYESVGDYGCDSSSFFLFYNFKEEKFYEVCGSHCSCHGFEGQFQPSPSSLTYLQSDKFGFRTGGYDENDKQNELAVKQFLYNLDIKKIIPN